MPRLPSDWTKPSPSYGWLALARNVVPYYALLGCAPALHAVSPAAPWLLAPPIGLFAYRLTLVMHDCVHRTLFTSEARNVQVGRWLGAITAIDFESFRRQHFLHHRAYGTSDDPQRFHYAGLQAMSRPRLVWHLLKPLLGCNVRHVLPETVLAPRNVRPGDLAAFLGMQAIALALVTGGGRYWWLAPLPPIAAATFGLFFSQLRGIAEHGTVERASSERHVRSHAPHWIDRLFLYDVNFNYHAEHHQFPHYASRHLPALHGSSEYPRSMFGTVGAMLMARRT